MSDTGWTFPEFFLRSSIIFWETFTDFAEPSPPWKWTGRNACRFVSESAHGFEAKNFNNSVRLRLGRSGTATSSSRIGTLLFGWCRVSRASDSNGKIWRIPWLFHQFQNNEGVGSFLFFVADSTSATIFWRIFWWSFLMRLHVRAMTPYFFLRVD